MDRVAHLWPDISKLVVGHTSREQTFLAWRSACCYTRSSTLKWHLEFSDNDTLPVIRFNLISSRRKKKDCLVLTNSESLARKQNPRVLTKYPPSVKSHFTKTRFPRCLCNNTGVAAASRGDLAVCQFLWTIYPRKGCVIMMYNAVRNGHLNVCEFLKSCGVTAKDIRKHSGNLMLQEAASQGFVHICKFLKDLGLTVDDVCNNPAGFFCRSFVLDGAVRSGHLPMLQFFREWKDADGSMLTIQTIRAHNDELLCLAAKRGHLHVITFLMDWCTDLANADTEPMTLDAVRPFKNEALVAAAERGDVATFQFFKDTVGLALTDVVCDNGEGRSRDFVSTKEASDVNLHDTRRILWSSAAAGHLNVLKFLKQWIMESFDKSGAFERDKRSAFENPREYLRALDNYENHSTPFAKPKNVATPRWSNFCWLGYEKNKYLFVH